MKPSTWNRVLIALGALLVLGALDFAIIGKERIERDGEVAYLQLTPVDPRSLMQGDYMALRFAIVQEMEAAQREGGAPNALPEGAVSRIDVALDSRGIAHLSKADQTAPGTAHALKLRYRVRNGGIWLGTNAFFFEEGSAERFNGARYGEFRVDRATGEAVLVGLRDAALKPM